MRYTILLVLFTLSTTVRAQPGVAVLSSPDGRLAITFRTVVRNESGPAQRESAPSAQPAPAGGQLVYAVSFQGKPLIEPSALRLALKGAAPLGENVRLVNSVPSKTDETYRLVAGKTNTVRDHFNALRVECEEDAGRKLVIEARAYDDAVAFRYLVPEQAALSEFRLTRENTEFRISKDSFIYALILPNYRTMYESEFLKLSASSLANQGGVRSAMLIGLPLLMEVPGVAWMAITEADLRDYAAMYLVNPSASWTGHWFQSSLSPHLDDPETAVVGGLPHHSAWRVLMVATEPAKLIESNVITSLNPPPAIKDTSWIKPGRAAWDWWSGSLGPDGKSAFTTATMKYYADFAAQSGFEYVLVDAGWSPQNDILRMNGRVDIPEVVRYAAAKNVKTWIWARTSAVEKQMNDAFPLFEKWGVAGVKIDFVERDDQEGINFYYRAAEQAAAHHLMLDFHGATKPTGLERTFPNVLGYEAVLGMEQSKAGSRDNPDHHVMLPFTRMLAGPMDYTPGGFSNVTREDFQARMEAPMVMGTRAHHLAMYVVYEAPFQMVSDHPGAYKDQPAFEFIKNAPSSWDETRALQGEPGEHVTIARRRGSEWFLGSMTNWKARNIEIPLSFLGAGEYTAVIYADAPDADRYPKNTAITRQRVTRATRLKAQLAPGGGYAVRFIPLKP
jgi:alpha-glucosidase